MSATLDIVVLAILAIEPKHGYQIMKDVEQLTGQSLSIGGNRLYPLLRTLENRGAIVQELAPSPTVGAPSRHVYSLTPQGKIQLENRLQDLQLAESDEEFMLAVALFSLTPANHWPRLLQRRWEVLEKERRRLGEIIAHYDSVTIWPQRVTALRAQHIAVDQQWIRELLDTLASAPDAEHDKRESNDG